jgi:hypothetical protein
MFRARVEQRLARLRALGVRDALTTRGTTLRRLVNSTVAATVAWVRSIAAHKGGLAGRDRAAAALRTLPASKDIAARLLATILVDGERLMREFGRLRRRSRSRRAGRTGRSQFGLDDERR